MQINNIEIPEEGLTKQYITDPIGQTMYIVFTNVSVQAVSLTDFQTKVDAAKQQVVAAQALADELDTRATEFAQALETKSIEIAPAEQVISE